MLGLCLLLTGAFAVDPAAPAEQWQGLRVSDPWMRFVMAVRPAAGYFTLSNATSKARTLVGASSPACGMLMLHRTVHAGGVDRMEMVKDVAIPAGGSVSFAPGGYHLMCMSPSVDMVPGRSVAVTLHFDGGGDVMADFPVRAATDLSATPGH